MSVDLVAWEKSLPTDVRLEVVHLHPGNSSRNKRRGHKYRTIARIRDLATDTITISAEARCCRADTPSRKKGREIAVGRLKFAYENPGIVQMRRRRKELDGNFQKAVDSLGQERPSIPDLLDIPPYWPPKLSVPPVPAYGPVIRADEKLRGIERA